MVEFHEAPIQDRDGVAAVIVALLEVVVCVEQLFADNAYAGFKLHDALKKLGVSEFTEIESKARWGRGIHGLVAALGGGTNVCVGGSLPSSWQGYGEDGRKFSGPGEAGRVAHHGTTSRLAPEPTYVFGNRRPMTLGTDSKGKVSQSGRGRGQFPLLCPGHRR